MRVKTNKCIFISNILFFLQNFPNTQFSTLLVSRL